ncbi:MAG: hypothetical protein PHF84_12070, partial [bacterium]|nr:hypothetical protein [bacterium]
MNAINGTPFLLKKQKRSAITRMKNNPSLIKAGYRLLSHYLNYQGNGKYCDFIRFVHSLNSCRSCDSSSRDTLSLLGQNINARIMVLTEPSEFHPRFLPEHKKAVDELFARILNSINLTPARSYSTSILKCGFPSRDEESIKRCRDLFARELEIIRPGYVLGFGRNIP